ncbi:MAG: tRNA (adenosine(37)-N6)-dimethylallyltransferase MiaA [Eubacteriales bacterium]
MINMVSEKRKLVILTGPTGVGKTKLSISLAKSIGGEIISADSMQVYKHMDIGSAKIKNEEMEDIPHYLVDVLEPSEDFHVVAFQKLAKEYMEKIYQKGKIPILVGGTGFYIQSVLYDIDFSETPKTEYRSYLEQLAEVNGVQHVHDMLASVDQDAADQIHPNNVKRVIRGLEFFRETGEKISIHNQKEREKESMYDSYYFVLNDDRKALYQRIDQRVDMMIEDGLVEEVARLKDMGYNKTFVSMQGLGYKEVLSYLDDDITLEEAVYMIKRDTRHFAKRQLTWFKREKNVIWIDKQNFTNNDDIVKFMVDKI